CTISYCTALPHFRQSSTEKVPHHPSTIKHNECMPALWATGGRSHMSAIRFALVGAGNIAKIYVAAFATIPDAVVTVVCNRTEATGRALAQRGGAAWMPDCRGAVRRDDVDAGVVATPSGTHGDVAVAAAGAGKHLRVEKPLDITLARVESI